MTESTVPQWKQDLIEEAEEKDRSNAVRVKALNDKQEPLNRQAGVFAVPVVIWGVKSLAALVGAALTYEAGRRILNDNDVFDNGSQTFNDREVDELLKDDSFWKEQSSDIEAAATPAASPF